MPTDEQGRRRSNRRRRSVLVLLFSMLPMLVVAGMLAPNYIEVTATDSDQEALSVRLTRRLSRFSHQPLLFPRDLTGEFAPELLDLSNLFSRLDYTKSRDYNDRSRLPNFPHTYGDVIVLDDIDQRLREIVFKDPVLMAKSSGHILPPPATDITPLGGGPIGDGPRFDDFLGPDVDIDDPVVVPEPSTGLLMGLGLVMLATVGRERAR
jgi:hypothetical protein